MTGIKNYEFRLFIIAIASLSSTAVMSESPQKETYEKQKVEKLEKDEGRYQQLKKDADLRGRTEVNKGNFDIDVTRGNGLERPPAAKSSN